jgi:hypothetical protein
MLRGSEWLPSKTARSVLQRGESRSGFLLFKSQHVAAIDIIRRVDTQFAISFVDSLGRRHEAVYDIGQFEFRAEAPARPIDC